MPSNTKGSAADQELIELQRALLSAPTTGVPAGGDQARKAYLTRRAAQREAYGQFVAEEDIFDPDGTALIFNAGREVPIEHVERFNLEAAGMVRRIASPELAARGMRFEDDEQADGEQPARTIVDAVHDNATAADASATNEQAEPTGGRSRRAGNK